MKRILLTLGLFSLVQVGLAQAVGPSPVPAGSTQTYTFTSATNFSDWYWEAEGGEVISQSKTGSVYSASVHWTTVSTSNKITLYKYVVIHFEPGYLPAASKIVEVQQIAPSTPNVSLNIGQSCDYTYVSYPQDAPENVAWYWQTAPDGTSTSNNSKATTIYSAQALYLRARNLIAPYQWSTNSQSLGTITVKYKPSPPSVSNPSQYCAGEISETLGGYASGTGLLWYSSSTGGTGSSSAPSFPATAGTFYYYVSQTVNSCESDRATITVTVNPRSSAPTVTSSYTYCQYDGASTLYASGTNLLWYTSSSGGTGSSTTPAVSTNTPGTFYYYVSQNANGCEGDRATIVVTVKSKPSAPSVSNPSPYVAGEFTGSLGSYASGSGLLWYSSSTGGVGSSSEPSLPTTPGTFYYYVSQTVNGCESDRATITVIVKTPLPLGTNQTYCQYDAGIVLSASGTNLLWYTTSTGGTGSSTAPTPSTSASGAFYYYVSQTVNGSEGDRATIVVTVKSKPSTPSVSNPSPYVAGEFTGSLGSYASGSGLLWYASSTGGTGSSSAPSLPTTSGTFYYYVSQTINGCESDRVVITVTVKPPLPLGTSQTYCQYDAGISLSASGTNLLWYTTPTGGGGTSTVPTPGTSASGTFYYYVTQTVNGVESNRATITITVYAKPALPTVPAIANTCMGKSANLSGTPGLNSNTIVWYDAGGNYLDEGTTFSTAALNSTAVFQAESFNTGTGCFSSSRASVTVNVAALPSIPSGITDEVIYGSGSVTISNVTPIDADQVKWYTDPVGGTAFSTGTSLTTSLTSSTRYYLTSYNSVLDCESPRTPITITVAPYITAPPQIETEVMRVSGITTDGQIYGLSTTQRNKQVTYFDGMSRVYQQVSVAASPNGYDVVQPAEYNDQGRAAKNYLPYVASTSDGSLKSDFKVKQSEFYLASNDKIANDASPYATATFEDTPLARPLKVGGIGADWQPATNHVQQFQYTFNTATDNVRKFNTNGSSSGAYPANKLYKTVLTDENNNLVITFADDLGRTVLKRVQLDEVINSVMVNYLETYYVYDDFGRMKYTISPKGVAALQAGSWSFTQSIKDQYVYEYVYDVRGRVVEKKVPGSAWAYYGYDDLNRLVLMQDGLLRAASQWLFIKYDQKSRAVMQGLYTNTADASRAAVQTLLDGLYTSSNPTYGVNAWYETRGSVLEGYTNNSFPKTNQNGSALNVLSVNYFDDYDFDNNGSADFGYTAQGLTGNSPQQGTVSEATQGRSYGRATGSKRLVLGTSTWLYTYVFYDSKGRVIQVRSDNHLSATKEDLVTNVFDYEGKLLTRKTYHKAGAGKITTIINKYEYDAQGRLIKVYQNNNGAGSDQLVAKYEFNELGQLVDKKLHGTGTPGSETFLQSVDFRYNLKGQLASINNAQLTNDGTATNDDTNDYFGLELLYNNVESALSNTASYNGNISAIKWKGVGATAGATDVKSYKYNYDKSDKLETATSQMYTGSAWTKESGVNNETLNYDHNGNIQTLKRYNKTASGAALMDDLTYTYYEGNGNRLQKVEDATANDKGFKNGATITKEYTYDTLGNVTADKNKGIDSVKYNFLGKVSRVKFSDGKVITYLYDAGGNKLKMSVTVSAVTNTTDYAGSFVYENSNLSFFGSPEGRVVKNGSNLEYQYSIADHQGNTRVVFSSATPAPEAPVATLEPGNQTSERSNFLKYDDVRRVNAAIFDHTNNGVTNYSVRLSGTTNETYGLARSLAVAPGDKVKAEVYAKYVDLNPSNWSAALTTLMSAITTASTGTVIDGEGYGTTTGSSIPFAGALTHGSETGTAPKAYLNWLVFDNNDNFILSKSGFARISETAKESGSDIPHALMQMGEIEITEPGFVYIYLSNENGTPIEVYFDDFKVTHTKTNIIQYNEYYPFGLQTSNSYTRENTTGNNFLYNAGNELNQNSGWYEMFFRGYDPALGRMLQVDPYASSFASQTPYNYAINNPIGMNDPSGGSAYGGRGSSAGGYRGDGTNPWARGRNGESNGYFFNTTLSVFGDPDQAWGGGRGGNWSAGSANSDWTLNGGSQSYQDGIAAGMTDIGGALYFGTTDGYVQGNYQDGKWGYWETYEEHRGTMTNDPERGYVLGESTIGMRYVTNGDGPCTTCPTAWDRVKTGWIHLGEMYAEMLTPGKIQDLAQIIIIGSGNEQFGLKNMGNGKVGVWDLNDKNSVMRILDLTIANSILDTALGAIGISDEDPRNQWIGHPFDRLYEWMPVPGKEGLYFNTYGGEKFQDYYYQYYNIGNANMMVPTPTKTPWSKK